MRRKNIAFREARAGMLFVMPTMLIFGIFVFVPLVVSFGFSVLDFDMLFRDINFVGLSNYERLFSDPRFYNALRNTFFFTAGVVPIQVFIALMVGIAISQQTIFNKFLRSVYFLPAITSMTIVAIVWRFLIDPNVGIFAYYLSFVGIQLPRLLSSPTWAMPTIIFISIWKNFGLSTIIMVAGLQSIPEMYYEAADIDGAGPVQKFFRITLPQIRPTLTFVVITSVIASFQVFDQVFILTGGGPLFRTETMVQYIYTAAFRNFDMPYASALSVSLLIITLTISLLMFKRMRKGEEDLQ